LKLLQVRVPGFAGAAEAVWYFPQHPIRNVLMRGVTLQVPVEIGWMAFGSGVSMPAIELFDNGSLRSNADNGEPVWHDRLHAKLNNSDQITGATNSSAGAPGRSISGQI